MRTIEIFFATKNVRRPEKSRNSNEKCIVQRFNELPRKHFRTDLWRDLEEAMEITFKKLFNEAYQAVPRDLEKNESVKKEEIFGKKVLEEFKERWSVLYSFTGSRFYEWMSSIDCDEKTRLRRLSPDDFFITFNYIRTLEEFYKVCPCHIFHIHGDVRTAQSARNGLRGKEREHINETTHQELKFGTNDKDICGEKLVAVVRKKLKTKPGDKLDAEIMKLKRIIPAAKKDVDVCLKTLIVLAMVNVSITRRHNEPPSFGIVA